MLPSVVPEWCQATTLLKFKQCLKVIFLTGQASCNVFLCAAFTYAAIIYLMELGESSIFGTHFHLVLYSKTTAKRLYINLIHRHIHKGTTTENIASWFMNRKFTLYLHWTYKK